MRPSGRPSLPRRDRRDRVSNYHDDARIRALVAAGRHRAAIGGLWEEVGRLQLDFLVAAGLEPSDRVLDLGCGSLRAGVHLVRYLEPGHYFGIDLQAPLLEAGYTQEIVPAGLAERLPRDNLRVTGEFDATFAAPVDVVLAHSVFTHLPIDHLRRCLEALEPVVRTGGRFFLTYFEVPDAHPFHEPLRHVPGDVVTKPDRDPYHHRQRDILGAALGTRWTGRIIGEWGHPRDQRMALFERA